MLSLLSNEIKRTNKGSVSTILLTKNERQNETQITPRKYQYKPQNLKLFTLSKLRISNRDYTKKGFIKIGKNRNIREAKQIDKNDNKKEEFNQKNKEQKRKSISFNRIVINLDKKKIETSKSNQKKLIETINLTQKTQRTKENYHFEKQIEYFLENMNSSRLKSKRRSSRDIKQSVMKGSKSSLNHSKRSSQLSISPCFTKRQKTEESRSRLCLNGVIVQEANPVDKILKKIFKKMTLNNRAYQLTPCTLNLSYKELTISQLQFVNILFERIDPVYLNDINYPTFKLTALQRCAEELENILKNEDNNQNTFQGA